MSEETKNFIDKLAAGDNAGAGDAFKDALRVKVGQTLDNHRKDMAGNLFNQTDNPIPEAEAHSDPKPEIADPGTFDRDEVSCHLRRRYNQKVDRINLN